MQTVDYGQHIYLHKHKDDQGQSFVTADDWELFDMLDDFLTEACDIDHDQAIMDWPHKGQYTIVITAGPTFQELTELVQKLDLGEIERVYQLNNE